MMQTSEVAMRLPGTAGAWRMFSAARTLLALVGLAVVLALALPAPREILLLQFAVWSGGWESEAGNVTAGTIQPGAESPAVREQRAVSEFIAKRYRVAQDAISGFVATAYRAGTEWKVDPLLILAVMAIESRYNPVAESAMGARGLMQVIPKFHGDKLLEHGGETETALQMYAGAFDEPSSAYAFKVLAERARLEQMLKQIRRAPSA